MDDDDDDDVDDDEDDDDPAASDKPRAPLQRVGRACMPRR